MTTRKGDIKHNTVLIYDNTANSKATNGYTRPYKTTEDQTRPHNDTPMIEGHNRQSNIILCHRRYHFAPIEPLWTSFWPIGTFFVPLHILVPVHIFVPFGTWLHANKKKNNNKASLRTFERCSWSKTWLCPGNLKSDLAVETTTGWPSQIGILKIHVYAKMKGMIKQLLRC